MNDTVIKVQNLSKLYRLGELHKQTNSLRGRITQAFTRLARGVKRQGLIPGEPSYSTRAAKADTNSTSNMQSSQDDFIWALKDVSFEVKKGEALGVIGHNGAGKTTLLKILSRITSPTEGKALVTGRVVSLLEVGTGFHPELTGKENIYLNGAILGMRKVEIAQRFDKIVEFAEMAKFIDTPVKRYSSGMYVRLAFAVAAHLEPEILLVDEVLAVGDVAFQKKCLGKMENVAEAGRTVLFVSHNLTMIRNLCTRAILIDKGSIAAVGSVNEVVEKYLEKSVQSDSTQGLINNNRDGSGKIRFKSFSVMDDLGNPWLSPNRPAIFKMELETSSTSLRSSRATIAFGVETYLGERIIEFHTRYDKEYQNNEFTFGKTATIVCRCDKFNVKPGVYYLSLYIDYDNEISDRLQYAKKFEVREVDYFETGILPSVRQGWLLMDQIWSCEK